MLTHINKYNQISTSPRNPTNIIQYQQNFSKYNDCQTKTPSTNKYQHKEISTKSRNMKNDQEISTNIN